MPLLGCLPALIGCGFLVSAILALNFFFGSATGPLIAVVQKDPSFWFVIATALGYVVYRWRRHRRTFSRFEFATQLVITYLSVLVSGTYLLAGTYDVSDYWIDTEPLYGAEFHEGYTARDPDGDTFQVSAFYKARAGENGFWKRDITPSQYENLKEFCGNETLTRSRRTNQVSPDNGRIFTVDCLSKNHPAALYWQTPNYLQASHLTILEQNGRLPEIKALVRRIGLAQHSYPRWSGGPLGAFDFQRFWPIAVDVEPYKADRAQRILNELALSSKRNGGGFNPMLVAISTDATAADVADAVTLHWRAPKKTDVILVVNLGPDRRIQWASVLAATDDVNARADIESAIVALEDFDAAIAAETFAHRVVDDRGRLGFLLKDPEDYAYLTAGFGLDWTDFLMMSAIVLFSNWLTTYCFARVNPVLWFRRAFRRS